MPSARRSLRCRSSHSSLHLCPDPFLECLPAITTTIVKGDIMLIPRECTPDSCPVANGFLESPPGLAGNAFLLAAFASLIPLNLYTGIRYKTWLYSSLIIIGLVLEVVSHVGKILLHSDTANPTFFSVYLIANFWGPTIIGTAICTVLPHVMAIYGPEFRIVSHPIYINVFFMALDIFALAFQSVGSIFSSNGTTAAEVRLYFSEVVHSITNCFSTDGPGSWHRDRRPCRTACKLNSIHSRLLLRQLPDRPSTVHY